MGRRKYSEEHHEFLQREIPLHSHKWVHDAFLDEFGIELTQSQLRAYASNHHIKVGRHKNWDTPWTDEMDDEFIAFVPGHTEPEIIAHMKELFGIEFTVSQIANRKTKLKVKSGTVGGRFTCGHKWAGFQSEEHRRKFIEGSRKTRFKKGEVRDRPDGWIKPIGHERRTKEGFVEVKVKDGLQGKLNDNYMMRSRYVWEQHNGPIPDGCVIRHVNGIKDDDRIENLRLVTKAENARMNSKQLRPLVDDNTFDTVHTMAKVLNAAGKLKKEVGR